MRKHLSALAVSCTAGLAVPSFADIGFQAAIDTAAAFSPGSTVVEVMRGVDAVTLADTYDVEGYQPNLEWSYALSLDAATGEPLAIDLFLIDELHLPEFTALESVRANATIGFMDAVQVANDFTFMTTDEVISIGFMVEGGEIAGDAVFLVFEVVYNNGTAVLVDAVTGQLFDPGAEGKEGEGGVFAIDAMLASIAAAETAVGEGWTIFFVGAPVAPITDADIQVSFVNSKGMVVDAVTTPAKKGLSVSVTEPYLPIDRLAEDLAGVIPNLGLATVSPADALGAVNGLLALDGIAEIVLAFVEGDPDLGIADSLSWEIAATTPVFPGIEVGISIGANAELPQDVAGGVAPPQFAPQDLDQNGAIDGGDLTMILASWGSTYPPYDLDGSGAIDGGDLARILAAWGQ
ncbi:MAG: hypothetical protein RIS86_1608 [Planctomycetota bacterium]